MTANNNRDERLSLPSASSFETDVLCPGRQNMLNTLPPEALQETADDDADRGTRIHRSRETGDTSQLDEEDLEIYTKGMATEKSAVEQWKTDFQIPSMPTPTLEERLYLHWPDTLAPATSARLDVSYIDGKNGLVVEWKSLWCSNLTPAEKNWQGRLQAVLLAKEYELTHVRLVFNKAMFGKIDAVDYTENDLKHSEESIFHALYETKNPHAQRRAGAHCRYCPASKFCPEAAAMSLLPTTIIRDIKSAELSPEQIAERMSASDLVAVWSRSTVIVKILEAIKTRLKSFPADELSGLGLQLADGRKMDKIINTQGCLFYLRDELKMSEEAIWEAMSFGNGDVVLAIMRDLGVSKPKAVGVANQIIERFGETTYAAKSLERI